MEANTTDNNINQINHNPANGANPVAQQPARPVQPKSPDPGFYNNYHKQQGTIAYNVPTYTPAAPQTPVYRSAPTANTQSPSVIYNNAQNGNAPQYHYGNPTAAGIINNSYLSEQQAKKQQNKRDARTLRNLGNFAGFALVIYLIRSFFEGDILETIWRIIIGITSGNFSNALSEKLSYAESSFLQIIVSVLVLGSTFFFLHLILKKPENKITKEKTYRSTIKLRAPKKPFKVLLLILIGFGGCMATNYVVSLLAALIGIDMSILSMGEPQNILDIILLFISTAVIPPLVEEFSMRGVLLTSMQRYGNMFAIIATAFVFGLLHGNFVQIVFAFVCGLFFAYMSIATNSLWPAIIVHAMNNSMSCILETLELYYDTDMATDILSAVTIGGIVLGFIALIIYLVRYKKEFILKKPAKIPQFSTAKKFRKFMSSPGMIIATVIYTVFAIIILLATLKPGS